jgi:hypothetical protein
MVDDFDAEQAATMLLRQHGENAARYAAQWADALTESGNSRDGRKFAQIVDAIEVLSGKASPAKPLRSPLPRRKRV